MALKLGIGMVLILKNTFLQWSIKFSEKINTTVIKLNINCQFCLCSGGSSLDMSILLMNICELADTAVDARFGYGFLSLKNDKNPKLSIPADAAVSLILTIKIQEQ